MGYLIDTNVLSELQKGNRYHMFGVRLAFVIMVSFGFVLFLGMTLYCTAIKIGLFRNAKPQLGLRECRAKLGLGVPSRTDFTLNAS